MLKIGHIINPVKVPQSSDLYIAQPITFETMRIAKEYAKGIVEVEHFSSQFPEDRRFVPAFLKKTNDLNRSIQDLDQFRNDRKLPILKDILDRLYAVSNANYLIYTNCDIALKPNFYVTVGKIITDGFDAFVINRRTISNTHSKIEDIPMMYTEIGEEHRGFDCFVFKREFYPKMELGDMCIGALAVGRVMVWNLVSLGKKFQEFKDLHLTFHLGNERQWNENKFEEYRVFNRKAAHIVLRKINDTFGSIKKIDSQGYLGNFSIEKSEEKSSHIPHISDKDPFKFVFIIGLHRSGTTVLADCLKKHPLISGFSNTGFPKDEGQFLQNVFPIAKEYGGPGKFGFSEKMHLTESSSLLTTENKKKLISEWSRHWDTSKQLLLEKSPPNLLKTRFLQAVFPNSYFIFIIRHPIPTAYATIKWSKTSIPSLLNHWITCHRIFFQDKVYLNRLLTIRYEEFVNQPDSVLEKIYHFLDIPVHKSCIEIKKEINKEYLQQWHKDFLSNHWVKQKIRNLKYRKIEKQINKYDYSLFDIE